MSSITSKNNAAKNSFVAFAPNDSELPIQSIGGKEFVGDSPSFLRTIEQVKQVSSIDANVLLLGERGTGKSAFAEVIHSLSKRARVPFQQQNCAALPEELIERLLFGSVRGAFTGATDAKGMIEQASGGTLFLDEIGDSSPSLQAKLLRVIETKEVTRLGATRPIQCDVRFVFATNKDMSVLRPDFVDRIDEAQIYVPALRERREDLPALVRYFFDRMLTKFPMRQRPYLVDSVALKVLCEYYWPGNIRQLENVLFKTALLCMHSQFIRASDVGAVLRRRQTDNPPADEALEVEDALVSNPEVLLCAPTYEPGESLDIYFARVLVTMYDQLSGHGMNMNHSQVARTLGIERATLYSRLKAARSLLERASVLASTM